MPGGGAIDPPKQFDTSVDAIDDAAAKEESEDFEVGGVRRGCPTRMIVCRQIHRIVVPCCGVETV